MPEPGWAAALGSKSSWLAMGHSLPNGRREPAGISAGRIGLSPPARLRLRAEGDPMAKQSTGYRLVLCNCPPDRATGIAERLVEEKLAACVNVVEGVRSFYHWQGKLCQDAE